MGFLPDWIRDITFERPELFSLIYLWLFSIIGISFILWLKRKLRPRFARDSRQKTIGPDMVWLSIVGLIGFIILALAGPKLDTFRLNQSRDNLDIIFAIDKSVSMAIELSDDGLSKHDIVVKEVASFVSSSAVRVGDRLTLFTFSQVSNWRMPLSEDRSEFLDKLSEIEHPKDGIYYDRSMLYTYFGSLLKHIPNAIDSQDNFLQSEAVKDIVSWTAYPRVVFLFSDGDSLDGSFEDALDRLRINEIRIYPIGVGGSKLKMLNIRVPSENDTKKLERVTVSSRLNMEILDYIGDKTDGKSYVIEDSENNVQNFMSNVLNENRKPTLALVKTGESDSFWWDVLFIPSFLLTLLIFYSFAKNWR